MSQDEPWPCRICSHPSSVRDPCRDTLVDKPPLMEPVEAELVTERRIILGHQLRKAPAGAGDRLEPASAPTRIDKDAIDRRLAKDRRAVAGHVHDAAPLT